MAQLYKKYRKSINYKPTFDLILIPQELVAISHQYVSSHLITETKDIWAWLALKFGALVLNSSKNLASV